MQEDDALDIKIKQSASSSVFPLKNNWPLPLKNWLYNNVNIFIVGALGPIDFGY